MNEVAQRELIALFLIGGEGLNRKGCSSNPGPPNFPTTIR
jgi:hypothetical protein